MSSAVGPGLKASSAARARGGEGRPLQRPDPAPAAYMAATRTRFVSPSTTRRFSPSRSGAWWLPPLG